MTDGQSFSGSSRKQQAFSLDQQNVGGNLDKFQEKFPCTFNKIYLGYTLCNFLATQQCLGYQTPALSTFITHGVPGIGSQSHSGPVSFLYMGGSRQWLKCISPLNPYQRTQKEVSAFGFWLGQAEDLWGHLGSKSNDGKYLPLSLHPSIFLPPALSSLPLSLLPQSICLSKPNKRTS